MTQVYIVYQIGIKDEYDSGTNIECESQVIGCFKSLIRAKHSINKKIKSIEAGIESLNYNYDKYYKLTKTQWKDVNEYDLCNNIHFNPNGNGKEKIEIWELVYPSEKRTKFKNIYKTIITLCKCQLN